MSDDSDFQREPELSDDAWKARFVARMIFVAQKIGASGDFVDPRAYAVRAADAYLPDRKVYVEPEEAADMDISYWEEE